MWTGTNCTIFAYLSDCCIFILFYKIRKEQNSRGISLKSLYLYAIVFVSRYLDIPHNIIYGNWYLVIMKLIFLSSTFYVIYLMRHPFRKTYSRDEDTFPIIYLIIPSCILAIIFNQGYTVFEISWAFSLFLETLCIIPQIWLVRNSEGVVEGITSHYIICLGGYRAFYVINWFYRYFTEPDYRQWLIWICGIIQTLLYSDLFYYYITSRFRGEVMILPTVNQNKV